MLYGDWLHVRSTTVNTYWCNDGNMSTMAD